MANPFSVAAVTTFPKGPGQGTDNLTALVNNNAKGLGAVGTSQVQAYDDVVAPIKIKTGTSTSGTGTSSLYIVVSEDNSVFTAGINPDSASDQHSNLTNAFLIETINTNADSTTYYFSGFSVYDKLQYMPTYWGVVIQNNSGATYDATVGNFYAKHSLVSFA